jgi:hypothetical protein
MSRTAETQTAAAPDAMFRVEFDFELPQGYIGPDRTRHRRGVMRLATAADELLPLKDPRVLANQAYLSVILLSRVVTRLGTLPDVNPRTIEELFSADFAYLQDFYNRINRYTPAAIEAQCPKCKAEFGVSPAPLG